MGAFFTHCLREGQCSFDVPFNSKDIWIRKIVSIFSRHWHVLKLHEDIPRETNWSAEVAWLFPTLEDIKSVVTCLAAMPHECRHLFMLPNISLNILCIFYQGQSSAIMTDQKVTELFLHCWSEVLHALLFQLQTGKYCAQMGMDWNNSVSRSIFSLSHLSQLRKDVTFDSYISGIFYLASPTHCRPRSKMNIMHLMGSGMSDKGLFYLHISSPGLT